MKHKFSFLEAVLFLGILSFATLLRIKNLGSFPDWFLDEGEFILLAKKLAQGNYDFLGLRGSILLIGRPPMFFWLLAGAFRIFGADIVVLRGLTVLSSLGTIASCYFLSRRILGKSPAVYTAIILAILPEFVFYNRMGFTYNALAFFSIMACLSMWEFQQNKRTLWFIISGLFAGIALATDFLGMICVGVFIILIVWQKPKLIVPALFLSVAPILITILPIFIRTPSEVWQDLLYILDWGSTGNKNSAYNLLRMIRIYGEMNQKQTWVILGMIGVGMIRNVHLRTILTLTLGGIFILFSFSRVLDGQYLLAVWPIAAIGMGQFLIVSIRYLFKSINTSFDTLDWRAIPGDKTLFTQEFGSASSILLVFGLIFVPFIWMFFVDIGAFLVGGVSADAVMPTLLFEGAYIDAQEARNIASKIVPNLASDDFVVTPGTIGWLPPCNTADVRLVERYESQAPESGDAIPSRFTIPASLNDAKYAIVDESWRAWAEQSIEIKRLLEQVRSWTSMQPVGNQEVYCNPSICN